MPLTRSQVQSDFNEQYLYHLKCIICNNIKFGNEIKKSRILDL